MVMGRFISAAWAAAKAEKLFRWYDKKNRTKRKLPTVAYKLDIGRKAVLREAVRTLVKRDIIIRVRTGLYGRKR